MFQQRDKPTEAAHIAEELFTDMNYELERQCQSVQHAETRGIMSRDRALKAFKVTPDQYTVFLAKNTSKLLLPSNEVSWSDNVIAVRAMQQTMKQFAARQNPRNIARLIHLTEALNAMKLLTEDVEVPFIDE